MTPFRATRRSTHPRFRSRWFVQGTPPRPLAERSRWICAASNSLSGGPAGELRAIVAAESRRARTGLRSSYAQAGRSEVIRFTSAAKGWRCGSVRMKLVIRCAMISGCSSTKA